MATHTARLLFRRPVAEGTMAFHFEKPTAFDFRPGQAIDLALTEKGSASRSQDARHTFSIVSAPFQEELVVATRMRDSACKRALGALSLGSAAVVNGPFGALTLHKKLARPAILIAGGIGVTPFMSMLGQAAHDQLPPDLRLLYSNRRPEDASRRGRGRRTQRGVLWLLSARALWQNGIPMIGLSGDAHATYTPSPGNSHNG